MGLKNKWAEFRINLLEVKVGRTNLFDVLTKAAIFLGLLLIIPVLFSTDKSEKSLDMKIGSIATQKVVAPYNFYILKTQEEVKAERDARVLEVPFYFNYEDSITNLVSDRLDGVLDFLLAKEIPQLATDSISTATDSIFTQIKNELEEKFGFAFTRGNIRILMYILADKQQVKPLREVINIARRLQIQGILNYNLSEINRPKITVIRRGIEETLPRGEWKDLPNVLKFFENKLLESFDLNQTVILNYYFTQILKPNLIYDKKFTQSEIEQAIAGVATTKDMVYENERIVDANERINAEIYQKLISLKAARIEHSRIEGNWQVTVALIARMMMLVSILTIAGLYLFSFRKKVFANNKMLFMIAIIVITEFLLAALITGPLNWHAFLIPTTIVSMLLAILIDSGIAFIVTTVVALVLGGLQGGGYDITLMTLVSGMVAIFAVHNMRTRNQVFKAIVYIAFAYLWVIFTLAALRYDSIVESMEIFVFNLLPNAILSPFVTFMILGLFEKLFDITTDVTLLELSDLNHPLLKRLSLEAPGTFHHCMVVGNLSENAAKAIGANSLLARVGSYYHDIGKMEKPEYFVENQMDAENRHEELAPSMSALILASHVKNGIEMATENGIPKLIRDFIPEHHGTNIMRYFYSKALENAGDSGVNEANFRYPGPKPQSKETGIVMIADSVEAATRSLQNPTPNKIRTFVEDLVDEKFRSGELDECDITLRDLKQITNSFLPVLHGVFQHRIEYPDQDKKKTQQKQKPKVESNGKNGNSDPSP